MRTSRPTFFARLVFCALIACTTLLGGLAVGCSGAKLSLVPIGGQNVDAAAIDQDPLAVLPSGIIMMGYLDAQTMFASGMGADIGNVVQNVLPLGAESNFVPSRDITRLYSGIYAMQGVDFCAVVQGQFDVAAIRRAADSQAMTVAGAPLVKSRYAEFDVYTSTNIGFVLLTDKTILSGNEICMRRALDRLRITTFSRAIPNWMITLTQTQGAAFALAGDMTAVPAADAATQTLPFLSGLKHLRIIGNFQTPGLNFAGTMTYNDAESAQSGARYLADLRQLADLVNLLNSWGVRGSDTQMQVAAVGNDVQFTLPLDGQVVGRLLRIASDALRQIKQTHPAQ